MARIQTTHDYHPIEHATELWQAFAAEMERHATRSDAYRREKEEQRRDHDATRDAAWRPPTGT